ncbi:MAG TPA: SulP family inorganic anion transporter, partial [Thiobacillus sp.]|nr:SulP family inorganic anion transporter [Thiobacillus sp.]
MPALLTKFLPFLRWFPMKGDVLKADFMAGLTVALVLIPQSMAYAQLAGLPAYYGLYAAFLPVAVAALWGSSSQLGTGPVAVVSLLTASSLAVLATPGSDQFIALAIMLALLVGIIQLLLGVFKLGVIVNFLSHPVIVGFTNAAAIIIALSQVSKLFGVPMGRSEHFINDIVGVFSMIGDTHLPTLAMGALAIAIMWSIRKYAPKLPGVLIAVVVATLLSWAIGFERNAAATPEQIADPELLAVVQQSMGTAQRVDELNTQIANKSAALKVAEKTDGEANIHIVQTQAELALMRIDLHGAEAALSEKKAALRHLQVVRSTDASGATLAIYQAGKAPQDVTLDETRYRLR